MGSILDQIVEQTVVDLRKRRQRISGRDLESLACFEAGRRDFSDALKGGSLSVIAEIKKASPSKGVIRRHFNALEIAGSYVGGGASALSILTDEPFFQGSLSYLESVSKEFDIPLLRKDFIVDPYQVKEARAYGADAVLLIAAITDGNQLDELLHAAAEFNLEALVECYGKDEVENLNWEHINLFGVNNRDLHSFQVDLHRGVELLKMSPAGTIRVSESGLSNVGDLKFLAGNGVDAALMGEHLMRQPDPGSALSDLLKGLTEEISRDKKMEDSK